MATPQVAATGGDRPRGMSAEDKMMFKLGRPFEDVSKNTEGKIIWYELKLHGLDICSSLWFLKEICS